MSCRHLSNMRTGMTQSWIGWTGALCMGGIWGWPWWERNNTVIWAHCSHLASHPRAPEWGLHRGKSAHVAMRIQCRLKSGLGFSAWTPAPRSCLNVAHISWTKWERCFLTEPVTVGTCILVLNYTNFSCTGFIKNEICFCGLAFGQTFGLFDRWIMYAHWNTNLLLVYSGG